MTEIEKNKAKLQKLAVQYKAAITKKAAELTIPLPFLKSFSFITIKSLSTLVLFL